MRKAKGRGYCTEATAQGSLILARRRMIVRATLKDDRLLYSRELYLGASTLSLPRSPCRHLSSMKSVSSIALHAIMSAGKFPYTAHCGWNPASHCFGARGGGCDDTMMVIYSRRIKRVPRASIVPRPCMHINSFTISCVGSLTSHST